VRLNCCCSSKRVCWPQVQVFMLVLLTQGIRPAEQWIRSAAEHDNQPVLLGSVATNVGDPGCTWQQQQQQEWQHSAAMPFLQSQLALGWSSTLLAVQVQLV
jgi:hypothetical protein